MPEGRAVPSPGLGLAAALVVGLLAGAAVGGLDSGAALVGGAVVGLTAGIVQLSLVRGGLSSTSAGSAAVGAATLAGVLLEVIAVRGDSEKTDSMIGTGIMAAVLGAVCVVVVQLLTADRD